MDSPDSINDHTDQAFEQLLEQHGNALTGRLWRGRQHQHKQSTHANILDTGYSALNAQLHDGGWPLTTTTELGMTSPGIGELRLLMPALRELMNRAHTQKNVMWIAPPFLPFAPALFKEQIDVSKLTVVQTRSIRDTLWAAEQALLAECCTAVLCWTGSYDLSPRELRRLQLAAEKSRTWHVLIRHSDCLQQASASGLRLHLKSDAYSKLDIHILKQPQGWGGQHCSLSLHPHYENWQRLPVHLLPHHNHAQIPVLPERLADLNSHEHRPASVTVLMPLAALQTVH